MTPPPQKRRSNRLMGLVGILLILACVAVSCPMIFRQRHNADRDSAMRQMRSIGLAMLEFDQEFGSFPSDETSPTVTDSTYSELDFTGPHSNAYFRQLIAFGIQSEDIFYAIHPEGSHKPDHIMTPGQALAPGEVGLSYFTD